LTEDRQNPAFQQQYETAKESLRIHLTSAANAAEDRNTENKLGLSWAKLSPGGVLFS